MKKIKINKLLLLAFVLFSTVSLCAGQIANQNNDKEIQKIIASLTLKEKAQLLVGTFGNPKDTAYALMVDKVKKFVPGAAGFTAEFDSKGISTQVLADGPAGLRIQPTRKGTQDTYYCTAFPIATLLASTWDTELVGNVGKAMGNEVLEYGVDVILGPGMNLQRNPLCGRNFEYYSEDPLITGKMAASMVNGIQSNGVGTSVKHFAANNQETNRMSVDAIISQRALRELYLRGFEIAVKESQPWTVMSSYNKINGTYTSESNDLLTKILRNDWGFKGYVMTDWGGGSNPVAQMLAGNDVLMPGQFQQVDTLVKAVKAGVLSESVLDKNLARVLNIMLKTPKYRKYAYSSKPNLKANAEVTRKAAAEGMVLLENKNNALPFNRNIKKVAAFGNTSYEFISGGTGSGDVNEAYTISLIKGLENGGYTADTALTSSYSAYIKDARAKQPRSRGWWDGGKRIAEMTVTNEMASKLAQQNDLALITIGRNSGEGSDREAKEGDFYLTPAEKELISIVSESFKKAGKKAVVVLNIGGVIETSSWKNIPDAILLAWQPGQEGGNSVVDVLSGKINPSGKLAITFPISYDDVPSAKSFPGHAIKGENDKTPDQSGFSFNRRVPWEAVYDEDVYVGYRYYNTFNVPVSYDFGYGKSYTSFSVANPKLSSTKFDKSVKVTVEVKNTGAVAGKEVVQVYLSSPSVKMKKPTSVLVAFGKTKNLKPGETQVLSFEVTPRDLCSFDETASAWVAEQGKYEVKIGTSSRQPNAVASFNLGKELVVENVSNAMAPQKPVEKRF